MTTIEQAREFINKQAPNLPPSHNIYWAQSMAAFHESLTAWVPINSIEDLPSVSGFFWFTWRQGAVSKVYYSSDTSHRGATVERFSAWMPYTEPTPYRPTGGDDEV